MLLGREDLQREDDLEENAGMKIYLSLLFFTLPTHSIFQILVKRNKKHISFSYMLILKIGEERRGGKDTMKREDGKAHQDDKSEDCVKVWPSLVSVKCK